MIITHWISFFHYPHPTQKFYITTLRASVHLMYTMVTFYLGAEFAKIQAVCSPTEERPTFGEANQQRNLALKRSTCIPSMKK